MRGLVVACIITPHLILVICMDRRFAETPISSPAGVTFHLERV